MKAKASLATVLALLAVLMLELAAQDKPTKARAFRAAVVDMKQCFNANRVDWVTEIDEDLRQLLNRFAEELEKKKSKIHDIEGRLSGAPQGSALWERLSLELAGSRAELEELSRLQKIQYVEMYRRHKQAVYMEIVRAAGKVGREQGFTMVHKTETGPLNGESETITDKIGRRAVLYFDESVDITDDVIEEMNRNHRKKKKKDDY